MSDFNTILSRMLKEVSDSQDKRPSSIVYDSLAPTAAELTQLHIVLAIFKEQMNLLYATEDNLDYLASNYAITRNSATNAIRIAESYDINNNPMNLPVGSRFSVPTNEGGISFVLTENIDEAGKCLLKCESVGTDGNVHLGNLLPLTTINNLGRITIIGTQVPADDTETDDEFRSRIIERISRKSFGGNVADYKEFTRAIEGVGDLKVFAAWDGGVAPKDIIPPNGVESWIASAVIPDSIKEWLLLIVSSSRKGILSLGGGTVRLSVVDGSYNRITNEFIDYLKNEIDPVDATGQGVGIAPIGHHVTVVTPDEYRISVRATVMLSGVTVGQVHPQAELNINEYLSSLRQEWAEKDVLNVFSLMIANAILKVQGVVNVTAITLNNKAGDIMLEQTAEIQQLPYLGVVILSE